MATDLYFFTNQFPFGGESFVGNELEALSGYYNKIKLFPSSKAEKPRDKLPSNVELIRFNVAPINKTGILFSNLPMIISVFWLDFIKNTDRSGVIKKFRYNLSLLINAIVLSEKIESEIIKDTNDKRFVSFWMDDWALALSILKHKKRIKHFVFRVHQHDLYVDDDPEQYIPFRFFNIKNTDAVFPDSVCGVNYLKNFRYFPEKIKLGHLGVVDKGTNPFSNETYTIVSCSTLLSRKRVLLIAEVLSLVNVPITWIHFGQRGEPGVFELLKKKCEALPAHIRYELKGDVAYEDLIHFYETTPVSLFITLTRAEGLPVSVIEAVSFGVPVLATDIMGLPDVVTEESGILISPDLEKEKIAAIINDFPSSVKNTPEYRNRVKLYWKKNFSSDLNYKKFNEFVMSLS